MYTSKIKKIFSNSSGTKTIDVLSVCGDTAKKILIQIESGNVTDIKGRIHPCFGEVYPGITHLSVIPNSDDTSSLTEFVHNENKWIFTVNSSENSSSFLPTGVFGIFEPEIYREITFTAEDPATVNVMMLY